MFVLIRQIEIPDVGIWSVMVKVAPFTFGVYLIHDHLLVRDWLWKILSLTSYANQWIFVLMVIVACLLIFVICIVIDYFRKKLFSFLHIDDLVTRLDRWSYFSKFFT